MKQEGATWALFGARVQGRRCYSPQQVTMQSTSVRKASSSEHRAWRPRVHKQHTFKEHVLVVVGGGNGRLVQ
eukprot:536250-Amphidinium_carterae.2